MLSLAAYSQKTVAVYVTSTITFAKASASNAPTYYTELRCYGGSTMTFSGATMSKIEFGVGDNDKGNALLPNTGTMTNNATWEGNASTVIFTVDGDSKYRGISYITVTYEDNTVLNTYSDYLTTCTTQDIDHVESVSAAQKIITDGNIYILVGDKRYNIFGQIVK